MNNRAIHLDDNLDTCLLALPQVETTTTIKKTQIYDLMARGLFPKPIKLTPEGRRVAWLKIEVMQWIADRVKDSRSTVSKAGAIAAHAASKGAHQ